MELVKYRHKHGLEPHLYFYRDNHKNEVDVIVKQGDSLIPIEIKAAQTFTPSFLKGLRYLERLVPDRVSKGYLLYAGEQVQKIDKFELLNLYNATQIYTDES